MIETTKIGKRGTLVIPSAMRKRLGLTDDSLVILECENGRLAIRPAVALPVEEYSPERKAQFLLQNATGPRDYRRAVREVKKLGLDPSAIPHQKP